MKKRVSLLVLASIAASACSTDMGSGRINFSVPALSQNTWEAKGYPFKESDSAYCVVDGGYNSIRIILETKRNQQNTQVFIEGKRSIKPGTIFSVNSSDNAFRTFNNELTAKQSKAIVSDLENGRKVYLRWSEPHGDSQGRLNYTNTVKPEDFLTPYRECITFINQQKETENERS